MAFLSFVASIVISTVLVAAPLTGNRQERTMMNEAVINAIFLIFMLYLRFPI